MNTTEQCRVLHRPESDALQFLPEGPYTHEDGRLSWVAIQHGGSAQVGSVNILGLKDGINVSHVLPGRPGFAFPANQSGIFICGVERSLGLFDITSGSWTELAGNIDGDVDNTIVNDGVIFEDNVIFGCKDLEFSTKKAGLYLWRGRDSQLIQLRNDQVCSNGKSVQRLANGRLRLLDIDTPSKTVTRGDLDIESGTLGTQSVVLDLTAEDRFPDGMIATPDGAALIIAFYDPGDPAYGVARQYDIRTGQVQAEWQCPGSPRVTCPQLVQVGDCIELVLTTAVEHMEPEQKAGHPNAGCLFAGATDFTSIGDQPVYPL